MSEKEMLDGVSAPICPGCGHTWPCGIGEPELTREEIVSLTIHLDQTLSVKILAAFDIFKTSRDEWKLRAEHQRAWLKHVTHLLRPCFNRLLILQRGYSGVAIMRKKAAFSVRKECWCCLIISGKPPTPGTKDAPCAMHQKMLDDEIRDMARGGRTRGAI